MINCIVSFMQRAVQLRMALALVILGIAGFVFAQDGAAVVNSGDTAWMLISTALVMLMTPGLALFYGGMVRSKNVLSSIMHSFFALGLVTVQWILFGYSLAFSKGNFFIGGFDWALFKDVGLAPYTFYAATIPHQSFAIYQLMFAIITPALISGAIAERMKFSAYVAFILVWSTLVYCPIAHWVWGDGGWLRQLGALDFAGGTVVHVSSGIAALAATLFLGPRLGYKKENMMPGNMTMTVIGAGLLWFGWFGFNAGSALCSGTLAVSAFTATHVASAAAVLSWAIVEKLHHGKVTVLGAASGCVAGLVAVTPASGYVSPGGGLVIGLIAGAVCYFAVNIKSKFKYDDALDAFGVHGVGGTLGAILTGVFATAAINPAVADSAKMWIAGNLVITQIVAVAATMIYSFAVTCLILWVIKLTHGLRVSEEQETIGLDLTQHGEIGYNI